jgi:hypothetical protein
MFRFKIQILDLDSMLTICLFESEDDFKWKRLNYKEHVWITFSLMTKISQAKKF